ncbi:MAG: Holliday junction resolvase RuvX [Chitinophagales bacterium]|nr:Holliday junction resolvase RuvX [Chitinophagales bacterium]
MALRIIGIDYGTKRVGLAVTDPMQIIPNHLGVVHPNDLMKFLTDYCAAEEVEGFVVGYPKNLDNTPTDSTPHVVGFVKRLKEKFADKTVDIMDERFSSKIASMALMQSGMGKMKRREKGLIDEMSAVIILNDYLTYKKNFGL